VEVAAGRLESGGKRTVKVLSLRRLPSIEGVPLVVKDRDRLDCLAYLQYEDGARFWHIADANTSLEASELLAETGGTLQFPEK